MSFWQTDFLLRSRGIACRIKCIKLPRKATNLRKWVFLFGRAWKQNPPHRIIKKHSFSSHSTTVNWHHSKSSSKSSKKSSTKFNTKSFNEWSNPLFLVRFRHEHVVISINGRLWFIEKQNKVLRCEWAGRKLFARSFFRMVANAEFPMVFTFLSKNRISQYHPSANKTAHHDILFVIRRFRFFLFFQPPENAGSEKRRPAERKH
jgi:hypothetical protein